MVFTIAIFLVALMYECSGSYYGAQTHTVMILKWTVQMKGLVIKGNRYFTFMMICIIKLMFSTITMLYIYTDRKIERKGERPEATSIPTMQQARTRP